ncbi:MAG: CAP domain-containing protein [Deltaproteobacteria bacterium]|nr:CAP domain-containing protein [Deltaproteobacteria bacterium]
MIKFRLMICAILFSIFIGSPSFLVAQNQNDPYYFLNLYRHLSGLKEFQKNLVLEKSAQNHADYMAFTRVISHFQSGKHQLFTGKTAADRAKIMGYESRTVTENISVGQRSYPESIDALFETLYHRLLFLSLTQDEIGIAGQNQQTGFFVYNIGNSQLNRLCSYTGIIKSASYYTNVCNHLDRIPVKQLDAVEITARKNSPLMVLWPPDLSNIATIGFWEELPNPLGENQISGYPITVQLNPFFYRNIQDVEIELSEFDSRHKIPGKLITRQNDRHVKLSDHDFSFFSNQLLKWGTRYQVVLKFIANDRQQIKKWTFQTRNLAFPKLSISGDQELILLNPGKSYLIEIEAHKTDDMIKQLKWELEADVQLFVNKVYYNLLELQLKGALCQKATFKLNGNRGFTIQLSGKTKILSKYYNLNNRNSFCR